MNAAHVRPRRHRHHHTGRRWSEWAARVLEVLWSCTCSYTNIATARCYFCGRRPPRDVRVVLERALSGAAAGPEPAPATADTPEPATEPAPA